MYIIHHDLWESPSEPRVVGGSDALHRRVAADTLLLHRHKVPEQVHHAKVWVVVAQVPEGYSLHLILVRALVVVVAEHEAHVAAVQVNLVHGAVGVNRQVQESGVQRIDCSA